jgi:glycosyltransferase involved in cell wall biosynthesis
MLGVKYVAHGSASGFGMAALAYIRALHNAGVPVFSSFLRRPSMPGQPEEESFLSQLERAAERDASFADMLATVRASAQTIAYDTVLVHSTPELCRSFAEPGRRLAACTVWETDALPEHWPELLGGVDSILVPSRFNADVFASSGLRRPVRVVPHIRREAWSASAREDGATLRRRMAIPEDHFVFYTIGVWDPRKAVSELIDVFAREFGVEDRVTLLVKTSDTVENVPAEAASGPSVDMRAKRIIAAASRDTARQPPNVVCIAGSVGARMLDAIHAAGDAYVSLTRGEGWGLGAFDAATLGKPVIITGWGGQLDYLGPQYPGLVRCEMTPVTDWLPFPGYRPTQRWASADRRHAAQLMRAAVARDRAMLDAAASVRETIAERYAEAVVAQQMLAALDG